MDITVHGHTTSGAIDATIDGQRMTVPDDMANRHRQLIASWEADGHTIPAYVAAGPTADAVWAERDRRLALGFDYDFDDARGVHHIGTTPSDMIGWDDVTKLASARLALADTTPIGILTDTGYAEVSPTEWQQILLAAGAFRQPIWAASFALAAMSPIPSDYADDSYWTTA